MIINSEKTPWPMDKKENYLVSRLVSRLLTFTPTKEPTGEEEGWSARGKKSTKLVSSFGGKSL
jgi:hypothetical protein